MLFDESSISPDVAAARGYFTARSRADVPEGFARYQRRLGLVVPTFGTDGRPRGFRLRPDRPRVGRNDGRVRKYEQPAGRGITLDVNPESLGRLNDPSTRLWVTEGEKKGDALASRGECAVSLTGVYCGMRDGELLPDWDHVALRGRDVVVAFDSDVTVKPEVQLALERLTAALEARGAAVLVVYLPEKAGGAKQGVDDYLAAGGTVEELVALARPFETRDISRIRLSCDEKLRTTVEALWVRWWAHDWSRLVGAGERPNSMRGHSCRDVMAKLIEAAARHGKPAKGGIRVALATRTLAEEAATSRQTVMKVISHLEAEGLLRRDDAGTSRPSNQAASYVLLAGRAGLDHQGRLSLPVPPSCPLRLRSSLPSGQGLRAQRLRWSSPARRSRRGTVGDTRMVRQAPGATPREGVRRIGKVRGAVVDAVVAVGGSSTLGELCEVLHRSRPRDLRRRVLPMLVHAGVLTVDGDVVALASDWASRLEEARAVGGEIEREELERKRHRRQREAFRRRRETDADRHFANHPSADGHVEDLRPEGAEPGGGDRAQVGTEISRIAEAVRAYLDNNPHDACQPAGWIGNTLWALDLVEGKPTPAEVGAAIEELGGDRYRRILLEKAA